MALNLFGIVAHLASLPLRAVRWGVVGSEEPLADHDEWYHISYD